MQTRAATIYTAVALIAVAGITLAILRAELRISPETRIEWLVAY